MYFNSQKPDPGTMSYPLINSYTTLECNDTNHIPQQFMNEVAIRPAAG